MLKVQVGAVADSESRMLLKTVGSPTSRRPRCRTVQKYNSGRSQPSARAAMSSQKPAGRRVKMPQITQPGVRGHFASAAMPP